MTQSLVALTTIRILARSVTGQEKSIINNIISRIVLEKQSRKWFIFSLLESTDPFI